MNNEQLSEAFAEGRQSGVGSNMYIDGDTIYSYGRHFPIAKHIGSNRVLFNSDSYSNSTAKHKHKVRYALRGFTILEVDGCDTANLLKQQEANNNEIADLKGKIERARKTHTKERFTHEIGDLQRQNEALRVLYLKVENIGGVRE